MLIFVEFYDLIEYAVHEQVILTYALNLLHFLLKSNLILIIELFFAKVSWIVYSSKINFLISFIIVKFTSFNKELRLKRNFLQIIFDIKRLIPNIYVNDIHKFFSRFSWILNNWIKFFIFKYCKVLKKNCQRRKDLNP